jgi:hypothetical protein
MAPTIGDHIIFFNRLFFLSCTVVCVTNFHLRPFRRRFLFLTGQTHEPACAGPTVQFDPRSFTRNDRFCISYPCATCKVTQMIVQSQSRQRTRCSANGGLRAVRDVRDEQKAGAKRLDKVSPIRESLFCEGQLIDAASRRRMRV